MYLILKFIYLLIESVLVFNVVSPDSLYIKFPTQPNGILSDAS